MSSNKIIAKNTILLYLRLIVVTIIGLYVSRIVLLELGADDFGLYSVVGGFVAMLNFLNITLVAATNRFIAVEIGKGESGNPNKQFNLSLVLQLLTIGLLILTIITIGIFYVKNYLNIPESKENDAIFVLILSTLSIVASYLSIPFQGLVTAMEKFKILVFIEIFKAVLKLFLVFLLMYYSGNKLRFFSLIMLIVSLLPTVLYILYCLKRFRTIVKWSFYNKLSDYYEFVRYSGWVLLGVFASIARNQGAAVVINAFFGTLLNAAFGIATQMNNYIMMFVRSLSQAAVPQVMKSHSSGDEERSIMLVYYISKYSFFLMYLLVTPILLFLNFILKFWLNDVPEYTYEFVLIMIITGLFSSLFTGFDAAIHATGKIKYSHIFYSLFMVLSIPVSYLFYSSGFPPYTISIVAFGASFINQVIQTVIISKITSFKFMLYLKNTILPSFYISSSFAILYLFKTFFSEKLSSVILFGLLTIVVNLFSIYLYGLNKLERKTILNRIAKHK